MPECDLARPLTWLSGAGVMSAVLLLEGLEVLKASSVGLKSASPHV